MKALVQDLRYAIRTLRKSPGFTAVALLTLALGFGANTAIFSVVYGVLWKPVPYPAVESERVVRLQEKRDDFSPMGISYPNFEYWREQSRSFEKMGAWIDEFVRLLHEGEPMRVEARYASTEYLSILGVKPAIGRLYSREEDRSAAGVALLNDRLWRGRFGANPAVVGRDIRIGEKSFVVIGVLPPGLELLPEERVYAPLGVWARQPGPQQRTNHFNFYGLARLAPGVSLEQAGEELRVIARQLELEYPKVNTGITAVVEPYAESLARNHRVVLLLLFGAVGLVLLICCANVATLLLARAVSRWREMAVRAALGAGRWRLTKHALSESLLLSLLGAGLGWMIAAFGLQWLKLVLPEDTPRLAAVSLDGRVAAFTLAVSLGAAALFGLAPTLSGLDRRLLAAVQKGARGGTSRLQRRLHRTLLVAQLSFATVLLIGAGLLLRSMTRLLDVDPGFRSEHLLTMRLDLPGYERSERAAFYRELLRRIEALPEVESAAAGLSLPLLGQTWQSIFTVADQAVPPRSELPVAGFNPVSSGYFKALGVRLLRGRPFDQRDTADAAPVIVVNQNLANRIWPGEDPIGKRLKQGWPEDSGENHPWRTVVGVVDDVRQSDLAKTSAMDVFLPLAQRPPGAIKVAVRTRTDEPMRVRPLVRGRLRSLDPELAFYSVRTMDEIAAASVAQPRVALRLIGLFAGLALTLAAIGTYGVVGYSVAERTREFGVRAAVGAEGGHLFRLVVGQGLAIVAGGLIVGLAAGAAASRFLDSLLYEVTAHDPFVFAAVSIVLTAVALVALVLPARRAAKVDPMTALRYE